MSHGYKTHRLAALTLASCAKGVLVKSSGYTQFSCVVAIAMACPAKLHGLGITKSPTKWFFQNPLPEKSGGLAFADPASKVSEGWWRNHYNAWGTESPKPFLIRHYQKIQVWFFSASCWKMQVCNVVVSATWLVGKMGRRWLGDFWFCLLSSCLGCAVLERAAK